MDIPEPTHPEGHPGRDAECEAAVDMALSGMWEFFEDAGWTEEEFDRAVLAVAKRHHPASPG